VTHDPGHELLEAAAAAILVVGGVILLVLAWHAGRQGGSVTLLPEPPESVARAFRALAAALSVGAAAIHFAAAPIHLEELGPIGLGFVVAGTFQAAWALAWLIEGSRGVVRLGVVGNLAVLGAWAWSRTIGLPVGPLAGTPEPIAAPDTAATVFQAILVVLLLAHARGVEGWVVRRVRDAGSAATMALVPAVGLVFVATTLAVTVLANGHGHMPGEGHGQATEAAEHSTR